MVFAASQFSVQANLESTSGEILSSKGEIAFKYSYISKNPIFDPPPLPPVAFTGQVNLEPNIDVVYSGHSVRTAINVFR